MAMRKVLMISYIWPPTEGIGLVRALKFAKYLPEYGWEPIVLTTRPHPGMDDAVEDFPGGIKIFRTGYTDVIGNMKNSLAAFIPRREKYYGIMPAEARLRRGRRKNNSLAAIVREFIAFPDEQIGWHDYAVEAGKKIIEDHNVDAIFSTSPPETAHLAARSLKKYSGLPWVCDMRDLWSEDHYRRRPLLKKMLLKIMEKKVLKDADMVTTVSMPWAKRLISGGVNYSRISVIENAYDEEDFKAIQYSKNKKFTMAYMGKLHKTHQPVDVFFTAVADLITNKRIAKDKISINFYVLGYDHPDIDAMAWQYGVADIVRSMENVSYARSLEIQRSSDMLLFVQWQGRGSDGWYSAKLYDYLGARRPILALAKKGGIIEDLINRTSSGAIAHDKPGMEREILLAYDEFIKTGSVKYAGNEGELSKHTRLARTGQLADILTLLAEGKR